MTLWYVGGPEDFETHNPLVWSVMPASMRAVMTVTSPPLTPAAMLSTILALAAVPIVGQGLQVAFLAYGDYYNTAYLANPPGSASDTGLVPTVPLDYTPSQEPSNDLWDYVKVQSDRMYSLVTEWAAFKAQWEYFYYNAAFSGDTTPVPAVTAKDTARILAAIYYIAQLPFTAEVKVDADEILAAITSAKNELDTTIDGFATNTQNAFDSETELIDNVSGKVDAVQAAVDALDVGGGGPGGWPGVSGATLSSSVPWTGPLSHTEVMDGCIVHITSEPSGTGQQTVGSHTSWQHAGWLAFISDNGDADELQWLNLTDAVYAPKRMSAAAGVILFPRNGSSGTLTPWTKAV